MIEFYPKIFKNLRNKFENGNFNYLDSLGLIFEEIYSQKYEKIND